MSLTTFRKALTGKEFLVLDTETTGLHRGEICQIAIVNSNGETLLNELVRTKEPIPADSQRIHGITDDMVKDAPTWIDIAPKVKTILKDKPLVVYNAIYDRKMMHQTAERWELPKTEWKAVATWHCAMLAFAELYGDWNDYHRNYRWQKLTTAARYCRVPVQDAHSALGDCLMTLSVVNYMLKGGDE